MAHHKWEPKVCAAHLSSPTQTRPVTNPLANPQEVCCPLARYGTLELAEKLTLTVEAAQKTV